MPDYFDGWQMIELATHASTYRTIREMYNTHSSTYKIDLGKVQRMRITMQATGSMRDLLIGDTHVLANNDVMDINSLGLADHLAFISASPITVELFYSK